jgi:hypothetical protein
MLRDVIVYFSYSKDHWAATANNCLCQQDGKHAIQQELASLS